MPAGRRFSLATVISLGFHAVVVLLVGLLAMRTPAATRVLIPVELEIARRETSAVSPGGQAGSTKAAPRTQAAVAEIIKRSAPSSAGGRAKQAPAPPRLLTSRAGKEAAGQTGAGRAVAGPGGRAEVPAGPSYGAAIVGGPLPVYPKHALDQGMEGSVTVAVSIGPDGAAKAVAVESSSGQPLLDQAAVRAVKQGWAFSPAMEKGKAATGKVTIVFRFAAGAVSRE